MVRNLRTFRGLTVAFVAGVFALVSVQMSAVSTAEACGVKLGAKPKRPNRKIRATSSKRVIKSSKQTRVAKRTINRKVDRRPINSKPAEPDPVEPPAPEPAPARVVETPVTPSEPVAKPEPKPKPVRRKPRPVSKPKVAAAPIKIEMFFDTGSSEPSDMGNLSEVVTWMGENPRAGIIIEGHTDPVGSAGFNKRLSAKRARAIRARLISEGVSGKRIWVRGYGESRLAYPEDDDRNRRVVIRNR